MHGRASVTQAAPETLCADLNSGNTTPAPSPLLMGFHPGSVPWFLLCSTTGAHKARSHSFMQSPRACKAQKDKR